MPAVGMLKQASCVLSRLGAPLLKPSGLLGVLLCGLLTGPSPSGFPHRTLVFRRRLERGCTLGLEAVLAFEAGEETRSPLMDTGLHRFST